MSNLLVVGLDSNVTRYSIPGGRRAWYFGLLGAVIARSVGGLAIIGMTLMIARRFIQISVARQLSNIWRSLMSVAVMVGGVELLKHAMTPAAEMVTQIAQLASLIATGAVLYACTHLALWVAVGRPDGAEQFIFNMIGKRGRV